jgi:hypothetical protein
VSGPEEAGKAEETEGRDRSGDVLRTLGVGGAAAVVRLVDRGAPPLPPGDERGAVGEADGFLAVVGHDTVVESGPPVSDERGRRASR